jgi:predicted aconitase
MRTAHDLPLPAFEVTVAATPDQLRALEAALATAWADALLHGVNAAMYRVKPPGGRPMTETLCRAAA